MVPMGLIFGMVICLNPHMTSDDLLNLLTS